LNYKLINFLYNISELQNPWLSEIRRSIIQTSKTILVRSKKWYSMGRAKFYTIHWISKGEC